MTTRRRQSPVGRQRGGVLLILVMVLLVAAALAGALAVRGASSDLRMSGAQRTARSSFYCAEAGLNYARPILLANYPLWASMLKGNNPILTGGEHYPLQFILDSSHTVNISIKDNSDEPLGTVDDKTVDNDLTVIMEAQCVAPAGTIDPSTERTLQQIVTYTGASNIDQRNQAGHSSTHSGNEN